ncbi:MAG: glycosyltransferase family 4 protein [Desulforhopalus sp.]
MNIAYYMPFKPLGHANPSGDLVTGTELHNYLSGRGHDIDLVSRLRCRWIYYRPPELFRLLQEKRRLCKRYRSTPPDLWLTYHSYYKAPDLLGASCTRNNHIPYVIFQGIYSTKRRKQFKSLPGFLLNRWVLQTATHVFTNKHRDFINLRRLLEETRVSYIPPGIHPSMFRFSMAWRQELRQTWRVSDATVVMTAAMMRPGVKTAGLLQVIDSCAALRRHGVNILLVVAGSGSNREDLERQARGLLGQRVIFTGKIPRKELYRYYSAADVFAFPGIEESLGMVYLEAQSCGLPVVAFGDWGGGEAVEQGLTGFLSPAAAPAEFTANIKRLAEDRPLRRRLSEAAVIHIRSKHDLEKNYNLLEQRLVKLVHENRPSQPR